MPYRQVTVSLSPHLNGARFDAPAAMTWTRLKEKLRAHGVPGWGDESPYIIPGNEGVVQLATWENEGGSTHRTGREIHQ